MKSKIFISVLILSLFALVSVDSKTRSKHKPHKKKVKKHTEEKIKSHPEHVSYSSTYRKILLKPENKEIQIGNVNIKKVYEYKPGFYFGEGYEKLESGEKILKFYLIQEKEEGPVVVSSADAEEDKAGLYLFRSPNTYDPDLIIADAGAESPLGLKVYQIENHEIQELGNMNVITQTKDGDPESLLKYLAIRSRSESVDFLFNKNVIFDWNGEEEKQLKSTEIKYILQLGELKPVFKK